MILQGQVAAIFNKPQEDTWPVRATHRTTTQSWGIPNQPMEQLLKTRVANGRIQHMILVLAAASTQTQRPS
eukprot:1194025-Pyramimonas_sp.AAC.1